jgi:hypothetical protein
MTTTESVSWLGRHQRLRLLSGERSGLQPKGARKSSAVLGSGARSGSVRHKRLQQKVWTRFDDFLMKDAFEKMCKFGDHEGQMTILSHHSCAATSRVNTARSPACFGPLASERCTNSLYHKLCLCEKSMSGRHRRRHSRSAVAAAAAAPVAAAEAVAAAAEAASVAAAAAVAAAEYMTGARAGSEHRMCTTP